MSDSDETNKTFCELDDSIVGSEPVTAGPFEVTQCISESMICVRIPLDGLPFVLCHSVSRNVGRVSDAGGTKGRRGAFMHLAHPAPRDTGPRGFAGLALPRKG